MSGSFVHLHNHSDYSLLDGAGRVKDMAKAAARMGQPALALTDHGNMQGAFEFYHACLSEGVKPILGIEAYVAPGSRLDRTPVRWGDGSERDVSGAGKYTHLTLLAKDAEGLRNLYRLSSEASLSGFYGKPRIDRELMSQYGKGVICLTGCLGGEFMTRLRLGQNAQAREVLDFYTEAFDWVGAEVMDHALDFERALRDQMNAAVKAAGLQWVATNDSHYVNPEDAGIHDALLCMQTNATLAQEKRFRFDGEGYWLRSAEEMNALPLPELAVSNTLMVAEMVGDYSEAFQSRRLMAKADVPDCTTESGWLDQLVFEGLSRLGKRQNGAYFDRACYELKVINDMKWPGYFLVLADILGWAHDHGIRIGPGRGSAAGSLVAYALGITGIDPMRHGLMFERFLNPDRVSPPDIDVDIDESRRGEVIEYAVRKYGADRVAQISTFGTIKSRAAIKDANRVLGGEFILGERLSKALPPPIMGKEVPLHEVMKDSPRKEARAFREWVANDTKVEEVVELALGLEGIKRNVGVHAAGVILSAEPLIDILPLWKRQEDGAIIAGYDMGACESLGLLKMDFLGLRNLTVIEDCLRHLGNRAPDLDKLPLTDARTYKMLAEGHTQGVFQLDGPGITSLLVQMKPTGFEDISAVLALYRPGPMGVQAHTDYAKRKNGKQAITRIHPELNLDDILGETYGLIVYQEQVMSIAQKVAGYSLAQADLLRRAMGKKKKEILDKEFEPFAAGMRSKGYKDDAISALWETLVPFSDYAFNKSHTAGYGLVSYWTAYLKAHHPAEYMAALLTSVGDDHDKLSEYLQECRRMGIKILPPDINDSGMSFTPVRTPESGAKNAIRFGLKAIKNVGEGVILSIKQAGRVTSFYDFVRRQKPEVLNKKTVESLIKVGAFDSLGETRKGLLEGYEAFIELELPKKKLALVGLKSILENLQVSYSRPVPEFSSTEFGQAELMDMELELLGMAVTEFVLPAAEPLILSMSAGSYTAQRRENLAKMCTNHPGPNPVLIRLSQGRLTTTLKTGWTIDKGSDMVKLLIGLVKDVTAG